MMKLMSILAMLCTAALLSAADVPWSGDKTALSLNDKAGTVTIENGVITSAGKSIGSERYSYLILRVKTAPFTLNGKKLAATVWAADNKPGDSLYIKAKTAGNKVMLSAYNWGLPTTEAKQYTIVPEKDDVLKWIAAQIKAPIDSPIIEIEFHYGRKGNGNDMKLMVKDIKLVD